MSEQDHRLREHPEQRFHPPQIKIDLDSVAATLRAEPAAEHRPHCQETLYRHGPLTIALFLFERGASMPQHVAEGVVTVQVLEGRLTMTAEGQVHDLPAGSLLILAPGVQHDVQASEPTKMLLTVCLEGSGNQ